MMMSREDEAKYFLSVCKILFLNNDSVKQVFLKMRRNSLIHKHTHRLR